MTANIVSLDKCDEVGAYLLCVQAHISGLVATENCNNPFKYASYNYNT